jgi:phosphoadenosine phosphosulfate reductase
MSDLQAKTNAAITLLKRIETDFAPVVLATSFGAEDQVLTDLVARFAPGIGLFTLDTLRLHTETRDVWAQTLEKYKIEIVPYLPNQASVDNYIQIKGIDAFYESIELRKECCTIRKVEPLGRALADKKAWIVGLRKAQAVTRTSLPEEEWDETHNLTKFSPLTEWSEEEIWEYINQNNVPYNALHDKGFPSIGCAPCTRAILPGEDVRAGRWWWEDPTLKECGLHVKAARESQHTPRSLSPNPSPSQARERGVG